MGPLPNGLFMACKGGDPNYLLHGMILQVVTTGFFLPFLVTTTRKNWKIWFLGLRIQFYLSSLPRKKTGVQEKHGPHPIWGPLLVLKQPEFAGFFGGKRSSITKVTDWLWEESFAPNWELRTAKKTRHGGVLGREFHEMISVAYHPIRQHVWYSWILIPNWKKHDTPEI